MEHFENTLRIIADAVRSIREDEFNALKRKVDIDTLRKNHPGGAIGSRPGGGVT
jgi:hypothetical protein